MARSKITEDMKKLRVQMGKEIRTSLEMKGMTQKQLAEKVGVSTTLVGKWVRGLSMPNMVCQRKLAEKLSVQDGLLSFPNEKIRGISEKEAGYLRYLNKNKNLEYVFNLIKDMDDQQLGLIALKAGQLKK